MQVKLWLILYLPASALARGYCRCRSGDESFIDVTTSCCNEQTRDISIWIFTSGDEVRSSSLASVRSQKMNSVGVRSVSLTNLPSPSAVRELPSVIRARSVLKINSIVQVCDGLLEPSRTYRCRTSNPLLVKHIYLQSFVYVEFASPSSSLSRSHGNYTTRLTCRKTERS